MVTPCPGQLLLLAPCLPRPHFPHAPALTSAGHAVCPFPLVPADSYPLPAACGKAAAGHRLDSATLQQQPPTRQPVPNEAVYTPSPPKTTSRVATLPGYLQYPTHAHLLPALQPTHFAPPLPCAFPAPAPCPLPPPPLHPHPHPLAHCAPHTGVARPRPLRTPLN